MTRLPLAPILLLGIIAVLLAGPLACSSPGASNSAPTQSAKTSADDEEGEPAPPAEAAPAPSEPEPEPEPEQPSGRKMPGEGAMSTFVVEGEVGVVLRGSARDYEPGPIPAGTYPIIPEFGDGMPDSGTATCPPDGKCTVRCNPDTKTCEAR